MSSHTLDGTVAGGGDQPTGNRLEISEDLIGLEQVDDTGASMLASMPPRSLIATKIGSAEDVLADPELASGERDGVQRIAIEHPEMGAIVLRFVDQDKGRASWVFAGSEADVAGAGVALQEVREAVATATAAAKAERLQAGAVPIPDGRPQVSGAHRAIIIAFVLIIIAIIVIGALLVIDLEPWNIELPSPPEEGGAGGAG